MQPSLSVEESASVSPAHQVGPQPVSMVQSAVRRREKRTHLPEYSLPQALISTRRRSIQPESPRCTWHRQI